MKDLSTLVLKPYDMEAFVEPLLENSRYALFAAIEIHNKPVFPYRYQIATISLINAWELLLKAYIAKMRPDVKLIHDDGTSKQFEGCLECVKSTIGNTFLLENESIEMLYKYRCDYIHFYKENIDTILFSLFAKNVELYNRFLIQYFGKDISNEANLVLLPVGFKPPVSPIDFLSNKSDIEKSSDAIKNFIQKILASTEKLNNNGINEPIMTTFNIALINEARIKNADIIAAIAKEGDHAVIRLDKVLPASRITNDPQAQAIRVEEASLYTDIFTETYQDVIDNARKQFPNLIINNEFHALMKPIKENPQLYKFRYLDIKQQKGSGKGYFSKEIYKELGKHYLNKDIHTAPASVPLVANIQL